MRDCHIYCYTRNDRVFDGAAPALENHSNGLSTDAPLRAFPSRLQSDFDGR
jgi:hypothetical protein